jgi:hypothetical protein
MELAEQGAQKSRHVYKQSVVRATEHTTRHSAASNGFALLLSMIISVTTISLAFVVI